MKVHVYIEKEKSSGFTMFVPKIIIMFFDFLLMWKGRYICFWSVSQETQSMEFAPMPSIVICPPTLIGHWVYEVNKFVDEAHLNPLMYAGPPGERAR